MGEGRRVRKKGGYGSRTETCIDAGGPAGMAGALERGNGSVHERGQGWLVRRHRLDNIGGLRK